LCLPKTTYELNPVQDGSEGEINVILAIGDSKRV
jgi:hypothetical protein